MLTKGKYKMIRVIMVFLGLFPFLSNAFAAGVDISDLPMETKVQSAPPLIMFVIDDSGSMDWEVMTPEDEGKFDNDVYVFPETDPNYTSGGVLSGTERREWKSQWSGYNKVFYNPHSLYLPWPGKADASTTNPRGNPHGTTETQTLTLNDEYTSVLSGVTGAVIVDNDNGNNVSGNTYSESGSWQNSGSPNMYLGSARYTGTTGASATWTLDVPTTDAYNVYAWWNCFNDRDRQALYTISHAGGSTSVVVNQRNETGNVCGEWVEISGPHTFNVGTTHSVSVTRQGSGGNYGSSTLADAIQIIPSSVSAVPADISIKNSHYYTTDPDGNIYLVNIDPVNETRDYYLFNDLDTNDRVDDGELSLVDPGDVPDSIKKAKYDEDGNITGYYTAAEDLQNFANWYSFYRRRELTAKAAIAQSITQMAEVKVGLYTIHQRVVQPVLPVKLDIGESDEIVIADNQSAAYSESGSWSNSGSPNMYLDSARYTTSSSASATWGLNVPVNDTYNVYAWWNCFSDRDQNARYTINHAGGSTTIDVNQRQETGNVCGEWVQISGPHSFNAGTSHSISVARHSGSTGSSTLADAVKIESTSISYANFDETSTLLDQLYGMSSSGGTPLRRSLQDVGEYYHQDNSNDGNIGSSPFSNEADGGGCQKAYAIVMTDGFYNSSFSPSVGNVDNESTAYSGMAPYADSYSNTLADIAMKFYYEDLAAGLSNIVPTNSCDSATHQHMNTYTVSFGVTGTLNPDNYNYQDDPCFLNSATPHPTWPAPTAGDSEKIDDLWHAAVNGRGLFFSAQDPEQLVDALMQIVSDIALPSSGASVSVNSNELQEGLAVYQTRYVSGEWTGDVVAYPVDPYSGALLTNESDILWNAKNQIPFASSRKIATYDGAEGIPFVYSSLTTAQKDSLLFAAETDAVLAEARLNYLRGTTSGVTTYGFRYRDTLLGDIVHSAPTVSPTGKTLFVGGNDGMLHAFDTETGEERFAYVPNLVFDKLKNLTKPDYEHEFYVDLTPTVKALTTKKTMLVGGLGKGGKGIFALNLYEEDGSGNVLVDAEIASASLTESYLASNIVEWEYSAEVAADNDLGFTYSKPAIVRSNDPNYEWVIIIGNGYNSTSETAALYVFSLTGTLLKKIDTQETGSNGLSEPAVIDVNGDFKADYAYAGDLKGNMWKFDLTDTDITNWDVAYKDSSNDPAPLFTATGQPITLRPDVMYHCYRHGYMVIFGTGKFMGESDRTDTSVQSLYGIWDYGDDTDDSEYLGHITDRSTGDLSRNGLKLLKQTVIDARDIDGQVFRTFSNDLPVDSETPPVAWPTVADSDSGEKSNPELYAGWFVDFDDSTDVGERFIKDIIISNGRAFIVSFMPNSSPCSGGGDSFLYIMNACTGGRLNTPQFTLLSISGDMIDLYNDGSVYAAPTGKKFSGMLHVPTFVTKPGPKDRVYISSSTGNIFEEDIESERLGLLYWNLLND